MSGEYEKGKMKKDLKKAGVTRREVLAAGVSAAAGLIVGGIVGSGLAPTVEKTITSTVSTTVTKTETTTSPTTLTSTVPTTVTATETKTATTTVMPSLPKSGVIVYDPEKCVVCRACMVRCSTAHEGIASLELSRITIVADYYLSGERVMNVCQQCDYPSCYFACPVSAIKIDSKTGARYIDESVCIGCGSCAEACPFMPEVETLKKKTLKGKTVFIKCDLCKDREEGPACVEACPYGALRYVPPSER